VVIVYLAYLIFPYISNGSIFHLIITQKYSFAIKICSQLTKPIGQPATSTITRALGKKVNDPVDF